MSFLRKRKNRILLGVIVATATTSIALGAGLYFLNSDSKRNNFTSISSSEINAQLINKENLDIQNASQSINDNNLKQIEIPPKIEPKEKEKIIVTPDIKKPEVKKEDKPEIKKEEKPEVKKDEKTIPKPIVEKIEPEEYKPPKVDAKDLKDSEEIIINFSGINIKVRIRRPGRKIDPRDINLANPDPYLNNVVGKILHVEVTQELIQKNRSNIQTAFKNSINKSDLMLFKDESEETIKAIIRQNSATDYYKNLFEKYRRLFDNGDKVKEFLTDYGKSIYDVQIKQKYLDDKKRLEEQKAKKEQEFREFWKTAPKDQNSPEFDIYSKEFERRDLEIKEFDDKIEDAKNYKYSQLIANLDYSKFRKVAPKIDGSLQEGLVINPDEGNVTLTEDGSVDSYAQSPLLNEVTSRIINDNLNRRAFSFNSYYSRPSGDIENGNYPGWTKKDVTKDFEQYGIKSDYGIKVTELTNENGVKRKKGIVIDIDVSNPKGYENTKQIIENLKSKNVDITGYRIHNMGKGDAAQSFKDILKALPDKLPLLELFFDANSTNTSSLVALEGKEIDELSLYTLGNSLLDSWGINPNALRKVKWINTNDYNVSFEYKAGSKIATRIVFNSLSFDPTDYDKNASTLEGKLKKINEGLRIAYWVRNNEPFFQGSFGPGLDPDNNEKNNSYHQGLDLSRIPEIRSLRGFIFYDAIKQSNSSQRKIRRLKLYSSESSFEISGEELSEAGFNQHIVRGEFGSKSEILFSSPSADKVKIKGTQLLTSSAISNLSVLYDLVKNLSGKKIIVDPGANELKNQLIGLGYNVETSSGDGEIFV
ncbi:putative immunoglobulin-blocking virulence protein [Mycoplasma phocoeninasale]|uniref:putative immunoglobulin-blocking virulence protein n=1 Tax=Mycoplasma phocoeninasale TaxID=2726117 RepID=UPI001967AF5B|nr:putative immunoglobulin-blocking virulence protein [Mycoplasma phocoeninasale]